MSNCLLCLNDFVSSSFDKSVLSFVYHTNCKTLVDLPASHTPTSFITPRLLCRSSLLVSPTFGQSENRFVCSIYLGRFVLYACCRASDVTNMLTVFSWKMQRMTFRLKKKKWKEMKKLVRYNQVCKIRFCLELMDFIHEIARFIFLRCFFIMSQLLYRFIHL